MLSKLDLDPKCHSRNPDADADSSKTICRPPPYRGVDINLGSNIYWPT